MASWTDSIFNAGVPLQPSFHTGTLPGVSSTVSDDNSTLADGNSTPSDGTSTASDGTSTASDVTSTASDGTATPANGSAPSPSPSAGQEPGGVHHYPTPIVDIQLFKYDDFQLWVTDGQGNPAAVAPVAPRGSGNASIHVLYATPGSQLAQQKQAAESANAPLILGPDHPLAQQAFTRQQAPGAGRSTSPAA